MDNFPATESHTMKHPCDFFQYFSPKVSGTCHMEVHWTWYDNLVGGFSLTYTPYPYSLYRWGFLHFRYLKCLVNCCYLAATNLLTCYQVASKMVDIIPYPDQNREEFDPYLTWNIDLTTGLKLDINHMVLQLFLRWHFFKHVVSLGFRCSNDLGPHEFEPVPCHQLKVNKEAFFWGDCLG